MRRQLLHVTLPTCVVIVLIGGWLTQAGDLNPPAGVVAPTMHTLTEIFTLSEAIHAAVTGQAAPPGGNAPALPNDPLFAGVSLTPTADEAYLFLEDIPGEATAPGHEDWIELLSAGDMIERRSGTENAQFGPMRALVRLDRALPRLMERMASGASVNAAVVDFVHPTSGASRVRLEMAGLVVESVTPLYQAGVYIVEFRVGRTRTTYTRLDANGQPIGAPIEFCWDLTTNGPC